MDYDKLTELCRKRAKAETDMEMSRDYDDPSQIDYYHEMFESINKCLDIEEHKVIISKYRDMLGNICCRLETSQADCRCRDDEIKALEGILDEQEGLEWRKHKLFEEHMEKRGSDYFDKEENK